MEVHAYSADEMHFKNNPGFKKSHSDSLRCEELSFFSGYIASQHCKWTANGRVPEAPV